MTQIRLQPVVVQNVTTYGTVITVPNRELKLKPGMTANVKIEIAKRTNTLRVPNAALRFRPTEEIFAALQQAPPPEARHSADAVGVAAASAAVRGTRHTASPQAPTPAGEQANGAARRRLRSPHRRRGGSRRAG